jgi:GR25 family glycosyltransferase involved in LPS biosynthesis
MISITGHPVSEMYKREVLPSWKGYEVKQFEAVTPKDLVYKTKLDFGVKSSNYKREFTATEKAVWYSHFELWIKCINQGPLLVLEHDSKLVKHLPNLEKEGHRFLSFIDKDFNNVGKQLAPGSGYYITPPVAQRLVANAVAKPITQNSDGHLAQNMNYKKQVNRDDFWYIQQINFDGLNTIDHKNPFRKFIGPDYENFDISSVHGKAI